MELGYLTTEGFLVIADSLGRRFPFKAYRIDERGQFLEFLGWRQPLKKVANITIEVALHRNGWTQPGEPLLRSSAANMYQSRVRHYVLGASWRALRRSRWSQNPFPFAPWFSSDWLKATPVPREWIAPSSSGPFVVSFHDGAVKGCRRNGPEVELFAVELKEFTDFVLGKLKVTLTFATTPEAEAFARHYTAITDPGALDQFVQVEISRSPRIRPFKRGVRLPIDDRLRKRGLRWLTLGAVVMNLEMVLIIAFRLHPFAVLVLPASFLASMLIPLRERLALRTAEREEAIGKWPDKVWDRWASRVPAHSASFAFLLKDMGVSLNPDVIDLGPVDALLRKLPSDTQFGAIALGAGALVGEAFRASLGQRVDSEWVFDSETGMYVLHIRDSYWVSPVTWVSQVWVEKREETLQETLEVWTSKVRSALAFRHRIGFFLFGFTSESGKLPEELMARVAADAQASASESFVLGESPFRRRRVAYGRFSIDLIDVEQVDRNGPRFQPAVAIPFFEDAQQEIARIDGMSPHSPVREDVAIVRFEGQPMVPLGVELRNFVEVRWPPASGRRDLALRLNAVADRVEIASQRMRDQRPELQDFLVPMDPNEEGLPLSPYARFLGRIEAVREVTNPLSGVPLWLIHVSIAGFALDVLTRKDLISGLPVAGNYLSGDAWLIGNASFAEASAADYIR